MSFEEFAFSRDITRIDDDAETEFPLIVKCTENDVRSLLEMTADRLTKYRKSAAGTKRSSGGVVSRKGKDVVPALVALPAFCAAMGYAATIAHKNVKVFGTEILPLDQGDSKKIVPIDFKPETLNPTAAALLKQTKRFFKKCHNELGKPAHMVLFAHIGRKRDIFDMFVLKELIL